MILAAIEIETCCHRQRGFNLLVIEDRPSLTKVLFHPPRHYQLDKEPVHTRHTHTRTHTTAKMRSRMVLIDVLEGCNLRRLQPPGNFLWIRCMADSIAPL